MKVVLLSGGIDSIVCAELARRGGELAGCVFVDYGHPAQQQEGWKAFAYCGARGIPLKVVHAFGIDLGDMGSALGARVVPNRNAILLALAANAARALGGDSVCIGANDADQHFYRDCRPVFFRSMSLAIAMRIDTPLVKMSKREIIDMAREFGLTEADTWSCYGAGPKPCGACPSCLESTKAWS